MEGGFVSYGGPALLRLLLDECIRIAEMDFVLWGYHISLLNIIYADAAISGISYIIWKIMERD